MDPVNSYITLIKDVIHEWAEASGGDPAIETLVVSIEDHQQYLMVSTGWTPKTREHSIIFHVRVRGFAQMRRHVNRPVAAPRAQNMCVGASDRHRILGCALMALLALHRAEGRRSGRGGKGLSESFA